MNKIILWVIGAVALLALIISIGNSVGGSNQSVSVGGTTNYDIIKATGLSIGSGCGDGYSTCTGSSITQMFTGTCSLVSDSSIAATSTGTGTCAITGLVAGDKVFVSLATTTTKLTAQWSTVGTVAGTDSATVRLLNSTGAAAVPSATNGFGSSTQYWVIR